MKLFPIEFVELEYTENDIGYFIKSNLSKSCLEVSDDKFFIDIANIAQFLVQGGIKITIKPYIDRDNALIRLYLEGTILAALLHQRGHMSFHGTSFNYANRSILLCGVSGAGKSSVSAAFCQNGARLISDDVSPVRMVGTDYFILPLKSDIKLWKESMQKLNLTSAGLNSIGGTYEKYYFPTEKMQSEQKLDQIVILGKHGKKCFEVNELTGMDKFNVLRKHIYRREYLRGMRETEKNYFGQLFQLAGKIKVIEIIRPNICDIYETMRKVEAEIIR